MFKIQDLPPHEDSSMKHQDFYACDHAFALQSAYRARTHPDRNLLQLPFLLQLLMRMFGGFYG